MDTVDMVDGVGSGELILLGGYCGVGGILCTCESGCSIEVIHSFLESMGLYLAH